MVQANDEELVALARSGNAAAYSQLLTSYKKVVYSVAYAIVGNAGDAEEIVQDTFVDAYFGLPKLQNERSFGKWLCGICRNKSYNLLNRWKARSVISLDAVHNAGDVSDTLDPVDRIFDNELIHQIHLAFTSLSTVQKETAVLYFLVGYRQSEIAEMLDVPLGTVKRRIQAAKRKLKEELWPMVTDDITRDVPAELETKVQLALADAAKALHDRMSGAALAHVDAALELIDGLTDPVKANSLRAEALARKSTIVWFPAPNRAESIGYAKEALQLFQELGEKKKMAHVLRMLANRYSNMSLLKESAEAYQRALSIYEEIGDRNGRGNCLFWLAKQHFSDNLDEAHRLFQTAIPVLDAVDTRPMFVLTHAALRLIDSIKATGKAFKECMVYVAADCEVVEVKGTQLMYVEQPGFSFFNFKSEVERKQAVSVLYHLSQVGLLSDDSWRKGHRWNGNAFSYTPKPLSYQAEVASDKEVVNVPAGQFDCICIQWDTHPSPNDDGDERHKRTNQQNCGSRSAWFAPGVGFARLRMKGISGVITDIQLVSYQIAEPSGSLFPVAVGNKWVYELQGYANAYHQERVFEVMAREDNRFFVAHHELICRVGSKDAEVG